MCLAAYLGPSRTFTSDEVECAWANNPDGAGFLYFREDGRPVIYRTLHLRKFRKAYESAVTGPARGLGMAVHFRYATHGTTGIEGVHPFRISDTDYLMHNGVLPIPTDGTRSDTRTFAEDYLSRLPARWYESAELTSLVSEFVRGSKLIVCTSDPEARARYYIVRDGDGYWEDGDSAWLSNSSHCRPNSTGSRAVTKWARPSEWTGALADAGLGESEGTCHSCGVQAVSFGLCEVCGACEDCGREVSECVCWGATGLHTLTEDEWTRSGGAA